MNSIIFNIIIINTLFIQIYATTDEGLCALIAACDVASKSGYDEWSCSTGGITSSPPCDSGSVWTGLICNNDIITHINLDSLGITGTLPSELATMTDIQELKFGSNIFSSMYMYMYIFIYLILFIYVYICFLFLSRILPVITIMNYITVIVIFYIMYLDIYELNIIILLLCYCILYIYYILYIIQILLYTYTYYYILYIYYIYIQYTLYRLHAC